MDELESKRDTFVSAVLILEELDQEDFKLYLKLTQQYLDERYSDYEIIIVDQEKNIIVPPLKNLLLSTIPSIRWLTLAFPVETDIAFSVGIENAIGDFVVLMRPTIDPVEIIGDMVNQSILGVDVVIGIATHPRTLGYKIARKFGNIVLHSIGYHIPKNASPVRCLSRRAINTILRTGQPKHQFFIKVSKTGYPTKNYEYKLIDEKKLKKRTLMSGFKQSLKLIIFNSTKPLQWISLLGVLGSMSAFIFAVYSIIINLIKDDVIEGWSSMVFFSSFLFMILFIILAFIGEYLARILEEFGGHKSYYISSEKTSSVMLEMDRYNVLKQS